MIRALGLLALVSCLVACRSAATGLVVLVDSDFSVPSELSTVHIAVLDQAGAEVSSQAFAIAPSGDIGPAQLALPFSVGVTPRGGDASRRVDIVVTGLGPGDVPLIARRARTGFVQGQTLLLRMFLARSCRDVMCAPDATCTEDGCVSIEVPPATLRPIDPGQELDGGGARDGGLDGAAMADGGGADSGGADSGGADSGGASTVRFVRVAARGSCGAPLSASTLAIPVGRVLVATVAYREGAVGPIAVSDARGNTYELIRPASDTNPRMAIFTSVVTTPLVAGDTISATYPSGSVASSILVEELENAALTSPVVSSAENAGRSVSLDVSLNTVAPMFLYAVQGDRGSTSFTRPREWTEGVNFSTGCGGPTRGMTLRTHHRSAPAGAQRFAGDFSMAEDWTVMMLAIAAN